MFWIKKRQINNTLQRLKHSISNEILRILATNAWCYVEYAGSSGMQHYMCSHTQWTSCRPHPLTYNDRGSPRGTSIIVRISPLIVTHLIVRIIILTRKVRENPTYMHKAHKEMRIKRFYINNFSFNEIRRVKSQCFLAEPRGKCANNDFC